MTKEFKDTRGRSWFNVFPEMEGQLNFSILYPNTIKAFHRHQNQEDWVLCVYGDIKVVTSGDDTKEHFLTQGDTLRIPKNTWHGFQALAEREAGMIYYCTKKYDPKEPDEEREDFDKFNSWELEKK